MKTREGTSAFVCASRGLVHSARRVKAGRVHPMSDRNACVVVVIAALSEL